MLSRRKAREVAIKYSKEIRKRFEPDAVVFRGSYLNGHPHEGSLIDIEVYFDDQRECEIKLNAQLREVMRGLFEQTGETDYLYLSPFALDVDEGFPKNVFEDGLVLYLADQYKTDDVFVPVIPA